MDSTLNDAQKKTDDTSPTSVQLTLNGVTVTPSHDHRSDNAELPAEAHDERDGIGGGYRY